MRSIRGKVFCDNRFIYGQVDIDDGLILAVTELLKENLTEDELARKIIPGLVDIHMHGAYGYDVCHSTSEQLLAICDYEAEHGVTSIVPTTMTLGKSELFEVCGRIADAHNYSQIIKGINLEGPFISKNKCGAQNPEHAMLPDLGMFMELNGISDDLIKSITIAPELDGAIEFISNVCADTVVSLGHSCATYEDARRAMKAGANHVTHLYNGMNYSHRDPGIIGASRENEESMVELICDGIHVHQEVIRDTFKTYGANRVVMISDSTEATGMQDGEYMLGDQKVFKCNNVARLADGTIAGSVTNLYDAMLYAIRIGIDECDAIGSATVNPARSIGIDNIVGDIAPGKHADLVVTDDDYHIQEITISGR